MLQRLFSIRGKIAMLISGVVLLLAVLNAGFVPEQTANAERDSLRRSARSTAAMLADASKTAMEFQLMDSAQEVLATSLADPLVAWAALYDESGQRVAKVGAHGAMRAVAPAARERDLESDDWLVVAAAPIGAGGSLGSVAVALKTTPITERLESTRIDTLLLGFFVAVVGVLVAVWFSRRITRPLERVTEAAVRIAAGDVSQALPVERTNDEIGALSEAFSTMNTRLRELAGQIGTGADSLASAAAGMFSEVREQEALATQQTASLEEIRRTLEALAEAAERVANDSRTVREMSMRNLDSARQIAERTRMVSTHSERIGEILQLIQDIADRSDLLALNAALEGTKAGEVGRGFSLVAAEMRRLSEHVMDSVRDIRKLVADMREASHASVLATEDGIKLSQQTSSAAAKIAEAVGEQREGTAQAKTNADEIVRVVNESLKGRVETTRAAEALLSLSQELKDAASFFKLAPGQKSDGHAAR
jgi:methyl-accepting chemotaxis protein